MIYDIRHVVDDDDDAQVSKIAFPTQNHRPREIFFKSWWTESQNNR